MVVCLRGIGPERHVDLFRGFVVRADTVDQAETMAFPVMEILSAEKGKLTGIADMLPLARRMTENKEGTWENLLAHRSSAG